ncbi:EVE domain-containing protein [Candidatus Kaiserbacteria bacterium CG10_big_fil_rev_8_21_14_0_10_49_17]|uniref:EVE domain-containing protein n=1 Tax=Candidatus Kaiserbacteria bacterium CG10_big_fil_rev_8_21_14_0_10_49_17 TaxID=1974609 RepID=A0A2M6WEL2_9BACT|nr:MAG: EVE domain-containing protein [Candidatus Kaiserbacteria bacterium CG10_big_fil_rev_8_21_14_0_10_49_17]
MNYWLFKSEPDCFSLQDLKKKKTEHWDGVRNYQARNFLRDEIEKGDMVIFYHSSCAEPSAAGVAKVVRSGYPDFTAWDPHSEHPDPKSTKENPRWYMVDVQFEREFKNPVTLREMRTMAGLEGMQLLAQGNRLSVMPISKQHFEIIVKAGGKKK